MNSSASRFRLSSSSWRLIGVWGGALLLGGAVLPLGLKQPESAAEPAPVANTPIVWPQSDIVTVTASPLAGIALRGETARVVNVFGTAPVGGAVAKWLAEPGQRVEKNQPIIEISSGSASRAATPAEIEQTQAEKAQVAALNKQQEIAQKMTLAQTQLKGARERVERAQAGVARARGFVTRLRNGESVPLPAEFRAVKRPKKRPVVDSAAGEQLRAARKEFKTAQAEHEKAQSELQKAEKDLAGANNQLDIANVAVEAVEAKFEAKKASADEVQAARSALNEAQSDLKAATTTLETAKNNAKTREENLKEQQKLLEKAQLQEKNEPEPEMEENPNALSVEQAATLVASALSESRAAAREAELLKNRIDSYQSAAKNSQREVEEANSALQAAQQRVIDSAPRPTITQALAPEAGQLVWISRLANEVGPGDNVFGLATGQEASVRLEDKTQIWKKLQIGQILSAKFGEKDASTEGQIKVAKIEPPTQDGAAAMIEAKILGVATSGEKTPVVALVPNTQKGLPSVDLISVVPFQNKYWVALMKTPKQKSGITSVKWREVKLGKSAGTRVEIQSGLQIGEQIARSAGALWAQAPGDSTSPPQVVLTGS